MRQYWVLRRELLTVARRQMTTAAAARYVIRTMGLRGTANGAGRPSVLFLVGTTHAQNYLRATTFHGLREILGEA